MRVLLSLKRVKKADMQLLLTRDQARQMVDHAQSAYPQEACGMIGGVDNQALTIVPLDNISPLPEQHYHMDDAGLTRTLFDLQNRGWSLIGFYHSHPQGDPIPSTTDIQQATYPNTPYVIIGLRQRHDPSIAAWEMTYGTVTPVDLHIGDSQPQPVDTQALSTAQRVAIILGAAVAFIFILILSVTLLPPAPIIP